MWDKERWESRWRIGIMNLIGWSLAALFPMLFPLIRKSPVPQASHTLALLWHYPNFAYAWFGEDLPELLLLYVVMLAVAMITREWQSGTIEFLAQMPMQPAQIALQKGLWGSVEITIAAVSSSAVLWIASTVAGHHLAWEPYVLSMLLITVGFIGIWWLVSALAWALHSTLAVIIIGVVIFAESLVTASIPVLAPYAILTYISNTSPHPSMARLWDHVGMVAGIAMILGWVAIQVAQRQDWIPNHGRDQM
ncbi:MAG: hypothetical protein C7B46_20150 [Sulfobacillus benefaciens]|uniref:ABC transporter permease n=1 Tax=Sulfobacillus benefaciens TaxID=453960 RepID=A0A2T2WVF6_9FIRM|nr:MAG: hypothetical protein C7B46_20150 [Sulfobacillus benefaciens]